MPPPPVSIRCTTRNYSGARWIRENLATTTAERRDVEDGDGFRAVVEVILIGVVTDSTLVLSLNVLGA